MPMSRALRMKLVEASVHARRRACRISTAHAAAIAADPRRRRPSPSATYTTSTSKPPADQRADRTERELNANTREIKTMKAHLAELETRCASLDGLLRGKDATLTERARRIEDLQDQMMRLEARVDERNREITDLKRARDEAPPQPSPYVAARNITVQYNPQSKPI